MDHKMPSTSHLTRLRNLRITAWLTKLIESVEDEDEVLTALSEELGNFVEYVGGPQHGHVLLSPLENLAAIEEPLVREKAVESLNKICAQLSPQQIEDGFIPMLLRLSKADWFTSKISACSL